jgi:hypothetical protein
VQPYLGYAQEHFIPCTNHPRSIYSSAEITPQARDISSAVPSAEIPPHQSLRTNPSAPIPPHQSLRTNPSAGQRYFLRGAFIPLQASLRAIHSAEITPPHSLPTNPPQKSLRPIHSQHHFFLSRLLIPSLTLSLTLHSHFLSIHPASSYHYLHTNLI